MIVTAAVFFARVDLNAFAVPCDESQGRIARDYCVKQHKQMGRNIYSLRTVLYATRQTPNNYSLTPLFGARDRAGGCLHAPPAS
jgi:hypothetical protein